MWPGPYGEWGSRKYLLASLDQSLKRMGLDYVDIFYSHRLDPDTPLEETLGAVDTAVRQGKALYAGISSYSAQRTEEAIAILRDLGTPLLIHQPSYSLLNRWIEPDLLDVLGREGVGAIVFSPLGQGMLTDRYLDGIPEDSRAAREGSLSKSMLSDENLERIRALNEIAQRRGQTLAQLALAWTLRDPRVTSTLIGASSVAQLEDNVGALRAPGLRRRRAGGDRDSTRWTPGSTSGSGRARLEVCAAAAASAAARRCNSITEGRECGGGSRRASSSSGACVFGAQSRVFRNSLWRRARGCARLERLTIVGRDAPTPSGRPRKVLRNARERAQGLRAAPGAGRARAEPASAPATATLLPSMMRKRRERTAARERHDTAQAGWPGSIRLARWKVKSSSRPALAATGSSRKSSWSPASRRSRTRPTNQRSQRSRIGRPSGPSCQAQRANLSTSSPVSPPKSSARSRRVGRDAVDRERRGVAAAAIRAVLAREADREARRIDARLRGEADEAAQALVARAGGDDEHRVLEVPDDRVEGRADVHVPATYPERAGAQSETAVRRLGGDAVRRRGDAAVGVREGVLEDVARRSRPRGPRR